MRSVAKYVLAGTDWSATKFSEIICWPVVPVGMFALATTAEMLTGACVVVEPEFFFAPCTLAYAIALPATKRITPIRTNIIVLLFHRTLPPLNRPTTYGYPLRLVWWSAPLECTTGSPPRYIGPFDHSPVQRPWSGPQMVHMSYVPVDRYRAESNPGRIALTPIARATQEHGQVVRESRREGTHRGSAHEKHCEAIEAATRTTNAGAEMLEFGLVVVLLITLLYGIITWGLILAGAVHDHAGRRRRRPPRDRPGHRERRRTAKDLRYLLRCRLHGGRPGGNRHRLDEQGRLQGDRERRRRPEQHGTDELHRLDGSCPSVTTNTCLTVTVSTATPRRRSSPSSGARTHHAVDHLVDQRSADLDAQRFVGVHDEEMPEGGKEVHRSTGERARCHSGLHRAVDGAAPLGGRHGRRRRVHRVRQPPGAGDGGYCRDSTWRAT